MFLVPIVAGWALGVTSAKLADNGRQKNLNVQSIKDKVKASRIGTGIETVEEFKEDRKAPLWEKIDAYIEDSRSEKELLDEQELSVEEQIANQILKSSTILLASTSLALFIYPPLLYLHIPLIVYTSIPLYKQGFNDLFERRKVTFTVVDTTWGLLSIPAAFIKPNFLVLGALGGWFFGIINKIVVKTKENTRQELSHLFDQQPQIGQILIDASNYPPELQRQGKEIADNATLPTLTLGTLSLLLFGLDKGMAILYADIGRQMQVYGPLSVLNYLQLAARQGILIKDGRALEQISKVDTIVFDGAIELVPTIHPEAKRIIKALHQLGLDMVIISDDHEQRTHPLAKELGIKQYFAETQPEDKANHIIKLQEEGKFVCFVGDSINNAIALEKAQVGISLPSTSTIATDTAQIILTGNTLNQLEELFAISQQFEHNMKLNLAASTLPGIIIIGGAFTGLIGFGTAISISFIGMGAGVANAMRPLFQLSKNQ